MWTMFLSLVARLLGPKLAPYAKPIIYVVVLGLAVVGIGVAKCSYDRNVVKHYNEKLEQRAKPATDRADQRRVVDNAAIAANDKERKDAINAQPDQPISPTSHALACKRLRDAGKHPASCG